MKKGIKRSIIVFSVVALCLFFIFHFMTMLSTSGALGVFDGSIRYNDYEGGWLKTVERILLFPDKLIQTIGIDFGGIFFSIFFYSLIAVILLEIMIKHQKSKR